MQAILWVFILFVICLWVSMVGLMGSLWLGIQIRRYLTKEIIMDEVYKRAWQILKERITEKTGWGKRELERLMSESLEAAVNDESKQD